MKKFLILPLFCTILANCAQKPEDIGASYVSPTTYLAFSCNQLASEARRLDNAYTQAAASQRQARTNDTVGVILIGLPTASLSGSNIAPQIASLKGQIETVHRTQISKNCV